MKFNRKFKQGASTLQRVVFQLSGLLLVLLLAACFYFPKMTLEHAVWYSLNTIDSEFALKGYQFLEEFALSEVRPYFALRKHQMKIHSKVKKGDKTVPLVPLAIAVTHSSFQDGKLNIALLLSNDSPGRLTLSENCFFLEHDNQMFKICEDTNHAQNSAVKIKPWKKTNLKLSFCIKSIVSETENNEFLVKIVFNDGVKYGSMVTRLTLEAEKKDV